MLAGVVDDDPGTQDERQRPRLARRLLQYRGAYRCVRSNSLALFVALKLYP